MNDFANFEKSLNLCKSHLCCDDAGYYLYPPRAGGQFGRTTFSKIPYWFIDLSDGGPLIAIQYCPFCGEKLEEIQHDT